MRKKSHSGTVFLVILLLFFVIYLGYQTINLMSDKVQTIEASLVNVEDKLSSDGVFIRPQILIAGVDGKNAEYLVENGAKVANNEKIAMFFDNQQSLDTYRDYKNLSDKIKSDSYAFEHMSDGADGLKLDGLILNNMLNIASGLERGAISSVQNDYSDVKQIVARRDGNKTSKTDFNAKQQQMRLQLNALNSKISGNSVSVYAPQSGYFVSGTDGYENVFNVQNIDKLTADMLTNTAKYKQQPQGTAIGSIIDGYSWYCATLVTDEESSEFSVNSTVSVRFPRISADTLDMAVYKILPQGEGQSILVLKSEIMRQMYFNPRQEPIDIIKQSYCGIKVPSEALRQEDGQWGVYCLVGATPKFKPVEWIYQTDSYYLVKQAENSKKGLYNYDKIIISPGDYKKDTVIK